MSFLLGFPIFRGYVKLRGGRISYSFNRRNHHWTLGIAANQLRPEVPVAEDLPSPVLRWDCPETTQRRDKTKVFGKLVVCGLKDVCFFFSWRKMMHICRTFADVTFFSMCKCRCLFVTLNLGGCIC